MCIRDSYKDALEYELLIGSDFVPDLTCDEAFEMLDEVYSDSGLENFSSDYCLEEYELDNWTPYSAIENGTNSKKKYNPAITNYNYCTINFPTLFNVAEFTLTI